MSNSVTITGLDAVYPLLDPDLVERARRRTINELAKQSQTASSAAVRTTYTIKAAEFKAKMKLKLATSANGDVRITVTGKRFGLWAFTGTRTTLKGVSIRIKKSTARKIIQWSFGATMKSGHQGAFMRKWRWDNKGAPPTLAKRSWGRAPKPFRLPIIELTTLGAAAMFDQDSVYEAVQGVVDAKFDDVFRRNYAYYAAKQGTPSP